ncbi:MAG: Dyp-type peroxidase [Acidimicrobiia bacterium]
MITAQPGIFAQGTRSQYHLEFDVRPGTKPAAVAAAVAKLREPLVTSGGTNIVVGFRADLWRSIAPDNTPENAHDFAGIEGDGRRVPATPHDLWVWLHGTGPDVLLDNARAVGAALAPVAELAQEEPCFVYLDSRDLSGFIDGTENPPVEDAPDVALVPTGAPGEGGSHVITMKWVHDLAKLHALSVEEQEAVIGRTKPDSQERDDKPDTAHISRVVVEDENGEELEIYRRSVPYGRINELGLYFVAFSNDPTKFEIMLARMFGTADDTHDHLTDFTKPVSAAFYFAPSLTALRDLA